MKKKISYLMILFVLLLSVFIGGNGFKVTEQPTAFAMVSDIPLNGQIPETASDSAEIELEDGMTSPIYSTDDVLRGWQLESGSRLASSRYGGALSIF